MLADPRDAGRTTWLSQPFQIVARVRSPNGSGWGKLVSWVDDDGRNQWVVLLQRDLLGDPRNEAIKRLVDHGLRIAPREIRHLVDAISSYETGQRATVAEQGGWLGKTYMLGGEAFAPPDTEQVVYPGATEAFDEAGSLESWREQVANRCAGNSRLIIAVCAAFAAPLVRLIGLDGFGLHFRGSSSTGKTTALRVAASVWGSKVGTWRSTGNGLEAAAALSNDNLLCLDELSECDGRDVGGVVYMLANGFGKARAHRDGSAKPRANFKLSILSTGEVGIHDKIRDSGGGGRQTAGQSVRIVEISADAGCGYGMFELLGPALGPGELADQLRAACLENRGTAGRRFLGGLVSEPESCRSRFEEFRLEFREACIPVSDGQTRRVAEMFAVLAAAGELVTDLGITGWQQGEAGEAARTCFQNWLDNRGGTGSFEEKAAVDAVRAFIEQHGESRFHRLGGDRPTQNRVGFRQMVQGTDECYCFFGQTWRDVVLQGHDAGLAARALRSRGYLVAEPGRLQANVRGVDKQLHRVYAVSPNILIGP